MRQKHNIGFCNNFLDLTPKTQITKEKTDKRDVIKIKLFGHQKALSWNGKIIFASHTSDRVLISRIYIKNSYNSTTKNQTAQFKNVQRTWIDIAPKKMHRRPISTPTQKKNVQHHFSLGKSNQNHHEVTPYTH